MQSRDAELKALDVTNNGISADGGAALAALLQAKAVRELVANMNDLGDGGMYKLAEALRSRDTLRELDLGGNNVGPEGAAVLMGALRDKTSLHTLELGCAAAAPPAWNVLVCACRCTPDTLGRFVRELAAGLAGWRSPCLQPMSLSEQVEACGQISYLSIRYGVRPHWGAGTTRWRRRARRRWWTS